jgi:hypothetical protein
MEERSCPTDQKCTALAEGKSVVILKKIQKKNLKISNFQNLKFKFYFKINFLEK